MYCQYTLFNILMNTFSKLFSSYPSCSAAQAPGLAASMYFYHKVIAFIGPACVFALEPVARLAAFWNVPIITGLGDQVGLMIYIYLFSKANYF